jgi:hypothetical protein
LFLGVGRVNEEERCIGTSISILGVDRDSIVGLVTGMSGRIYEDWAELRMPD